MGVIPVAASGPVSLYANLGPSAVGPLLCVAALAAVWLRLVGRITAALAQARGRAAPLSGLRPRGSRLPARHVVAAPAVPDEGLPWAPQRRERIQQPYTPRPASPPGAMMASHSGAPPGWTERARRMVPDFLPGAPLPS
jgi:hypothetical protein